MGPFAFAMKAAQFDMTAARDNKRGAAARAVRPCRLSGECVNQICECVYDLTNKPRGDEPHEGRKQRQLAAD